MIQLTKIFRYEAAHALLGYDGRCSNLHGHSYELRITVKGEPNMDPDTPKYGMVMDFSDLKKIVNEEIIDIYDHALILSDRMSEDFIKEVKKNYQRVIILPFQPTTELMLIHFSEKIKNRLPERISLVKILLKETDGSYAEWLQD